MSQKCPGYLSEGLLTRLIGYITLLANPPTHEFLVKKNNSTQELHQTSRTVRSDLKDMWYCLFSYLFSFHKMAPNGTVSHEFSHDTPNVTRLY